MYHMIGVQEVPAGLWGVSCRALCRQTDRFDGLIQSNNNSHLDRCVWAVHDGRSDDFDFGLKRPILLYQTM